MKAIMVMYDSLNRNYLPNYGCDLAKMPNFIKLGERTVTFDNSYVGSLPCMPARREIHTGRLNFLHRSWSPIEPYDDSMPELLKRNGIHTHIVSDHQHYWEDGGATYHTRYSTWEAVRGQEGDPWKGSLAPVEKTTSLVSMKKSPYNLEHQDAINRRYIKKEEQFPQALTFAGGLEFIEENKDYDNWFLQIETFDPHEPFFSPEKYQEIYRETGEEPFPYDWPPYAPVTQGEDVVEKIRKKYCALLSMCDHYLGKVLDTMDRLDLWKDTMLIVNTDHGYLLGEHLWWAKGVMPTYNEMANTPLFIWDPRSGVKGERRKALVQTIDLAPTLLEYFGVGIPKDMLGISLKDTVRSDQKVRDYALFGIHGSQINITDGRFVYMRSPIDRDNQPLFDYTLMPVMMRARMSPEQLGNLTLAEPFSFTKGCRTLKISAEEGWNNMAPCYRYGNRLYDLAEDPGQQHPIDLPEKEVEFINAMSGLMKANDAPEEQFERMGIRKDANMTVEELIKQRELREIRFQSEALAEMEWEESAYWKYIGLTGMLVHNAKPDKTEADFIGFMKQKGSKRVAPDIIDLFAASLLDGEELEEVLYMLKYMERLD